MIQTPFIVSKAFFKNIVDKGKVNKSIFSSVDEVRRDHGLMVLGLPYVTQEASV